MDNLLMKPDGALPLPPALVQRYGLTPETPIRVIETQSGILLVPITNQPMSKELAEELAQWQQLSMECWDQFPYEEPAA
jgi:hypothetical protein